MRVSCIEVKRNARVWVFSKGGGTDTGKCLSTPDISNIRTFFSKSVNMFSKQIMIIEFQKQTITLGFVMQSSVIQLS